MTITLTLLPPELVERAQEIADARNTTLDALLSEAIAEYIEAQDDIAYARETLAKIRSGNVKPLTREEMEARLSGGAR